MTNLIKLARLFIAAQDSESALPLLHAIRSCPSVTELNELLAIIAGVDGCDVIRDAIHSRLAQLTLAAVQKDDAASQPSPSNDVPSPY